MGSIVFQVLSRSVLDLEIIRKKKWTMSKQQENSSQDFQRFQGIQESELSW